MANCKTTATTTTSSPPQDHRAATPSAPSTASGLTAEDNTFIADLTERAERLGLTYEKIATQHMKAGFEPTPPPEVEELVEELHCHIMSRTEAGRQSMARMEELLGEFSEEEVEEGKACKYTFVWDDSEDFEEEEEISKSNCGGAD